MKREYGRDQIVRDDTSVLTVGTYDGVHVGHQAILRYLVDRARHQGGSSVAVTFDPHPREVVHGEAIPLLTTIDERATLLERLGLDRFIVLPFTEAFSRLSADAFVRDVLVGHIGLQEIVIGYDHAFGKGREGDSLLLTSLGEALGFSVDVIPAQLVERHVVSSSKIRHHLTDAGDVRLAAQMLGRRYALNGTVVAGAQRGRLLGFPTANLAIDHPRKVIPREGVYAVRAEHGGGQRRSGMLNVGHRPTFGEDGLHVEVHLFGFEGDLYDQKLRVEFVDRIRAERRFEGPEALSEQLSKDAARCKKLLKNVP